MLNCVCMVENAEKHLIKKYFFHYAHEVEVCFPVLVLNKMRLELISRIGGIGKRLMFSGLVTRENSGKIREINNFGTNSVLLPKLLIGWTTLV